MSFLHLFKSIACKTPKQNIKVNYGFWMIMSQCWLISCNKCTTLVVEVDNVGAGGTVCMHQGIGYVGDFSTILLNFSVNLKSKK